MTGDKKVRVFSVGVWTVALVTTETIASPVLTWSVNIVNTNSICFILFDSVGSEIYLVSETDISATCKCEKHTIIWLYNEFIVA